MIKPTNDQLISLYPNVDVNYLNDHIDRKIQLIQYEDDIVSTIDTLIVDYKNQIAGLISLNESNCADMVSSKLAELEIRLADIELDSIIQLHETSGFLYECLLDKFFCPDVINEYGGEQDVKNKVARKKLLKQDIKDLISQTVSRNQTIATSINGSLKELGQGIDTLIKGKSIKGLNELFDKFGKSVKQSTRSILQQSVFDAETNTELFYADNYTPVYYRVEILDTSICMPCMHLDGTTNEFPLGLMHRNCRGIDVLLLRDMETGKYYDTNHNGYGHKLKTKSFEQKFESLSVKQKRQMLGKSNYDLYASGKLKPSDFLSYSNRQITTKEAKIKADMLNLKRDINTPQKANAIVKYIDGLFTKELGKMDVSELNAYEKALEIQRQLYKNVPKSAYGKGKKMQAYIDDIDAKNDALNKIKNSIRKE